MAARGRRCRRPDVLEVVPAGTLEEARWWEGHILEVLTGRLQRPAPGPPARPEYDPAVTTLRQRELAKVAELEAAGRKVALATVQRLRLAYERQRAAGAGRRPGHPGRLGDGQGGSPRGRGGPAGDRRGDEQVDRHREQAAAPGPQDPRGRVRGSGTADAVAADLLPAGGAAVGRASTPSGRPARAGRWPSSLTGPFGTVVAARPGRVDADRLHPAGRRGCVLDNGLTDRVELTWMIDLATRTIPAAVLRPTTKAVDAALLLARALTPEPMRPGWADALRMSRSVLPHRRLAGIDERLEHAAARPVIVPETIVCDHGMVYMSQTFRNACRAMGINFQPAHKGSPWEKGTVETSFSAVGTLFAQYVAGYVGNSVENRGKDAGRDAVWSMTELQELLDEWIVHWQNRPHDGLRHPLMPGRALTPNEEYAALVEAAGYVPVPLSENDYIELLPGDLAGRQLLRGQDQPPAATTAGPSTPTAGSIPASTAKKGLWEVHHDPYDVSRVWVRNHRDGGWIPAPGPT